MFVYSSIKTVQSVVDGSDENFRKHMWYFLIFFSSKFSVLKLYINKTKPVWIGSKIGFNETLCSSIHLGDITNNLGITSTAKIKEIEAFNKIKLMKNMTIVLK